MLKPEKIYRGIHLSLETLKKYNFNSDYRVHYDPLINQEGKETVEDGNEYGVI